MVESKSNNKILLFSIISFLLGVFVGLVILGWGLFPVQWTGGTLEVVDAQIQEDWLRMAIDSYSIHQDQEMALERYNALGSQKEAVLAAIWDNPGQQTPDSITAYASAVGVTDLAGLVPAPTPFGQPPAGALRIGQTVSRPLLAALAVMFCLLVLGVLAAFFLIFRSSRKKSSPIQETPPPLESQPTTYQVEGLAPITPENTIPPADVSSIEEPTPDLNRPGAGLPAGVALGAAALAAASLASEPTPSQAELTPQPTADTFEVAIPVAPAPAGAALGAAALAAASLASEPTPSQAELTPQPTADTVEAAIPVAPAPAGATLGAAALAAASLASEPTPSQAELTPQPTADIVEAAIPAAPFPEAGEAELPVASHEALNQQETEVVPETLSSEEVPASPPLATELPSHEAETIAPEYDQESLQDLVAKFNRDLTYVEGIGDVYARQLNEVGILTIRNLLEQGATPKGRKEIAEKTGISPKLIMRWVNHVDLFRIKGVGQEYADLLEWSGVDTVVELATRNAGNLFEKCLAINEQKKLVRKPPVLSQIQSWIEQAKHLPRAIYY